LNLIAYIFFFVQPLLYPHVSPIYRFLNFITLGF